MIDTSTPERVAAAVEAMAAAYLPGEIVGAAMELGVFDALGEPIDVQTLAHRVGATPDGVRRLLCALTSLGLVERVSEGRFHCPHAATLGSDGGLAGTVLHHRRQLAPLARRLPEAIRHGAPQYDAWPFAEAEVAPSAYAELARHPAEYALLLRAMDRASRGVGAQIATAVDLRGGARLLDLGGGGGGVARELLRCVPGLVVETHDLAPAADYASRRAEEAGLVDRHVVRIADLREPLPVEPAPFVLLSGVLADFPPDERRQVARVAARAVAPGGQLLISETLLDEDRAAPASATVLSLLLLAAFGGDQLTLSELTALLAEVGFHELARHPGGGGRDLVVAERSARSDRQPTR